MHSSTPTAAEAKYRQRLAEVSIVDVEARAAAAEASFSLRPELLETAAIMDKVASWEPPAEKPAIDVRRYPTTVHSSAGFATPASR